ncbi:hypothetical protein MITS9509_01343 [Synechococcus sp. MIT S9509]|uniref:hypothetical protein n=1 Tax=Synechococcus sp. MIT S9509 TaxID=1801630 RepID=UPI0007BADF69|nr:hypothetical protein [Synechococcus sp. MIT S9509]KZR92356.1 hypothetical protein MITS9509_01343 [Synechococcus sp. MIT S9509]
MSENIQGLLQSINELAAVAAADGNELRLAAACEVLRNGGADCAWPEEGYPEG